jgi:hypothetical protein
MRQLSVQRESELQAMARIVEASRSNDSSIRNELQYVKVKSWRVMTKCGAINFAFAGFCERYHQRHAKPSARANGAEEGDSGLK